MRAPLKREIEHLGRLHLDVILPIASEHQIYQGDTIRDL